MGYKQEKVGRIRKILAKKKQEANRPLPLGRQVHLHEQIERLEKVLKQRS